MRSIGVAKYRGINGVVSISGISKRVNISGISVSAWHVRVAAASA